MAKLTLSNILSGFRGTNGLNQNFDSIEAALEKTLSRDGTAPNAMLAPLDMNGQQILNLPAPSTANSAVRKVDLDNAVIAGGGEGGGGAVDSVNGKTGVVVLVPSDIGAAVAGSGVTSVNGSTGAVTVTAAGLGAIPTTQKAAANGVASLDSSGFVPSSQLPTSGSYKGTWNATTNVPTIVSGVGLNGDFYKVATAGTTTIDGVSSWAIGDEVRFGTTTWQKIANSAAVSSVAGKTGAVTLVKADVGLTNVDDTTDANKPVSTAQATAIGLKALKTLSDVTDADFSVKSVVASTLGGSAGVARTLTDSKGNSAVVDALDYGLVVGSSGAAAANSTLINNLMAGLAARGGGTLQLPAGDIYIASTLDNKYPRVKVCGVGSESFHDSGSPTFGTRLVATTATTMLKLRTPYAAEQGVAVANTWKYTGGGFKFLALNGGGVATKALLVDSVSFVDIDLWSTNFNATEFYTIQSGLSGTNIQEPCDVQFSKIVLRARAIDTAADRAATICRMIGSANANISLNRLPENGISIYAQHWNGNLLTADSADNNDISLVGVRAGGTGYLAYMKGPTASIPVGADSNTIYYATGGGSLFAEGTGTAGVTAGIKNRITYLDVGNGTPEPTAGTGSSWSYTRGIDNVQMGQPNGPLAVSDYSNNAASVLAAMTSESLRIRNTSSNHVRLTDTVNEWGINIDGATGNLRFTRIAGSGIVEGLGGAGVTLATTTPAAIGTAAVGTGSTAARADHVHDHGTLAGGSFHSAASTIANGFMSSSDKSKLDKIASPGTVGYVLTSDGTNWVASAPTGGGGGVTSVTASAPLSSTGGTTPNLSITAATTSASGSMSAADKTKVDATGVWANWGPTVSAASGTFGSTNIITARYSKVGKDVQFQITIQVITVGTASGSINFTLPFTTAQSTAAHGTDLSNRKVLSCLATGSTLTMNVTFDNNVNPISAGNYYIISGVYESV